MLKGIIAAGLLFISIPVYAQIYGVSSGPTLPATCRQYSIFVTTAGQMKICGTSNDWTDVGGGGGSVPTGSILLTLTTCPTGFEEATELNGITLVGTLAANGNVGNTGGSDNITPAGTNSALTFTGSSASTNNVSAGTPAGTNSVPTFTGNAWSAPAISGITATFTGNALAGHAHELPWQIPTTTTIRQIAVATFGTGTSRAATAVSAAGTANTTSAAVALSQSVTAGTPAGTVNITNQGTIGTYTPTGTVTAPTFTGSVLGTHGHTVTATGTINTPTFTGTQFDNRSAFKYVIFCRKI